MNRVNALILTALLSLPALADDYVEWVGANSGVNWSAGQAQAEGAGMGPKDSPPALASLMACRAAIVDAQRNLLESMRGVRVQGTTIVENMMVESDVIETTVEGVLTGAQVVDRQPADDGTCRVTMTAPLSGQLASTVYDEIFPVDRATGVRDVLGDWLTATLDVLVPSVRAAEPETWRDAFEALSGRLTSLERLLSTEPNVTARRDAAPTGLVLDALGSNFIPSMSPRIRKLRADVIYPDRNHQVALREHGRLVSLFTRDLETARNHPIVGERPLVLKGLRTFGDTRTEIVLGTESSPRLEELVTTGFLDDAGVVIVL